MYEASEEKSLKVLQARLLGILALGAMNSHVKSLRTEKAVP